MRKNGSITVFLAMVFACILSLLAGLVEAARISGGRLYLQSAANSAMDSVFSEYHRELWEKYRIALLECDSEGRFEEKFEKYLSEYLSSSGIYALENAGTQAGAFNRVTELGGLYLEREIVSLMKYELIGELFTEDKAKELSRDIGEADKMKELGSEYNKCTRQSLDVENAIADIAGNFEFQKAAYDRARASVYSENMSEFIAAANELENIKNKVSGLERKYMRSRDSMINAFEKSKLLVREAENGAGSGIKKENISKYNSETGCYHEYMSEDTERHEKIMAELNRSGAYGDAIERAKALAEEIDEIEEEDEGDEDDEEEEDEDDEGDEDDDSGEADALREELRSLWEIIECPLINFTYARPDKEKENILKLAYALFTGNITKLVLPEGRSISGGAIDISEMPSSASFEARSADEISYVNQLIAGEYAKRFFDDFTDNSDKNFAYELEYIAMGKDSDRQNLELVIGDIMMIREALNYIHILSDSDKRQAAMNTAMAISGGGSLAGFTGMIFCLVVGVWALGESLLDLRSLLEGKRISLYKTSEEWNLDLDMLMELGGSGIRKIDTADNEKGMKYCDYIGLLLMKVFIAREMMRFMDMMQKNIQLKQKDFLMEDMIYHVRADVSCEGRYGFILPLREFFEFNDGHIQYSVFAQKAY